MDLKINSRISKMFFAPSGQIARGDVLVCIFQRGGVDGLNMVIPVGDSHYHDLRPTIRIQEPKSRDPKKAALDLDGYFALHPALASLKPLYQDASLAIVHAVGLPDPTHSHFDAQDNLERCTLASRSLNTGWLGRHLASKPVDHASPLRAVGFGPMLQNSLRGPQPAIALQSLAQFRLTGSIQDPTEYQNSLQALYMTAGAGTDSGVELRQAADEIRQVIAIIQKMNIANYSPSNQANYPQSDFGLAMMNTAQLIKADVGLEVACLDAGGWDTHSDEGGPDGVLDKLLLDLAQGMAAFAADLGDRMKSVLVVTMSEFGRRVQENGSYGTDHGHGNAMFLMGGGVIGGKVHGKWPTLAPDKLDGPGDLAVTTDMRDVLGEVVQKRLLNPDLATVFPDYKPKSVGVLKAIGR